MKQDAHTDKQGVLHVDHEQNYHLDDAELSDDSTAFIFHRSYDTCDDDDYLIDVIIQFYFFLIFGLLGL